LADTSAGKARLEPGLGDTPGLVELEGRTSLDLIPPPDTAESSEVKTAHDLSALDSIPGPPRDEVLELFSPRLPQTDVSEADGKALAPGNLDAGTAEIFPTDYALPPAANKPAPSTGPSDGSLFETSTASGLFD
jgi:hypothetical protein